MAANEGQDPDQSVRGLDVTPNGSQGAGIQSIHGDMAARRRAITELLFFASVGDLRRCQRLVRLWNLKVSDPATADYDKRTPLHLAASEGSYKVTEWLLANGADVNALDRFRRTPLEDAVRGEYNTLAKFLIDNGGKVFEGGKLIELSASHLSGAIVHMPKNVYDLDPDWEVDPASLVIMEKLGEGEFGIVHKAMWYGTLVAAKILKGSSAIALGDFRSEIEVLRKVHHPNSVQFLGACTKAEPYILVTELMPGGSLADMFRMRTVVSTRRGLEIALDAARGLAYMHNRKPAPIVHRDLKPGNLMVAGSLYQNLESLVFDTGTIKLADFGLSKSLPINKHAKFDLDDKFKLTGETGSYRYMAPEVFRHEPYNYKVDVYSFSMIMYQLFEHTPPFAGTDPVEAAREAAMHDARPGFQQLKSGVRPTPEIKDIIEDCWNSDPEKRPQFTQVVERLAKLVELQARQQGPPVKSGGCCTIS